MLLTGGAEESRDLPAPGRDLAGVHFAMEALPRRTRSMPATSWRSNPRDLRARLPNGVLVELGSDAAHMAALIEALGDASTKV